MIEVPDNLTLNRYMDLDKLESQLENNGLFMTRPSYYLDNGDPYEGSLPVKEAQSRLENARRDAKRFGYVFNEEKENENYSKLHRRELDGNLISCWMSDVEESAHMWSGFTSSSKSILLQVSSENLKSALNHSPDEFYMSRIRYLNYRTDIWYHPTEYPDLRYNAFKPLVHKRREFRDEREVRILHDLPYLDNYDEYWSDRANAPGEFKSFDWREIITNVILHPKSKSGFMEEVRTLLSNYEVEADINRSSLADDVYY